MLEEHMARWFYAVIIVSVCVIAGCGGGGSSSSNNNDGGGGGIVTGDMVVLGYSELGMHCLNQDFSQFMILPPYNNLRAQVIDRRGEEPRIITSGITIDYTIPSNTSSSDKTNFWTYVGALLGVNPAPDIGLSGNGLSGAMTLTGENDWVAEGIPITPINDSGLEDAYPLATITVKASGTTMASTKAVVPVSWEISCDLCHNGTVAPTNILKAHDDLHVTDLASKAPVECGSCHAQAPLGALGAGKPGVSTLSRAMHNSHSTRMGSMKVQLGGTECYACHPGKRTQCLRDVHYKKGMTCDDCHSSMVAVASTGRRPWVDEPRCGDCHNKAGSEYEQPGTLYRNSKGHKGVHCAACHGSPHAITPTTKAADNVQAIALQGHAGTIDTCTVCHKTKPDDAFPHRVSGD
jgi:hypothetical protein